MKKKYVRDMSILDAVEGVLDKGPKEIPTVLHVTHHKIAKTVNKTVKQTKKTIKQMFDL